MAEVERGEGSLSERANAALRHALDERRRRLTPAVSLDRRDTESGVLPHGDALRRGPLGR